MPYKFSLIKSGVAISGNDYFLTASCSTDGSSTTIDSSGLKIPKQFDSVKNTQSETSLYVYYSKQLKAISNLYRMESDVSRYLVNKFEFCETLVQLEKEIKNHFENPELEIKLIEDNEINDWVTLKIIISQSLDFKIAHEKIQQIVTKWLYFQDFNFRSIVNISLF